MSTKNTTMYEEVMARLRDRSVTHQDAADGSGVPVSTVRKISQKVIKSPSVHHVQALKDFFDRVSPPAS